MQGEPLHICFGVEKKAFYFPSNHHIVITSSTFIFFPFLIPTQNILSARIMTAACAAEKLLNQESNEEQGKKDIRRMKGLFGLEVTFCELFKCFLFHDLC